MSGPFAPPGAKIDRSAEFLASCEFGPGRTRIQLRKLHEVRGEMEHWSLCNSATRPEPNVADRLMVNHRNEGFPKGSTVEAKQTYLEFRESVESMRANLPTPEKWIVSYTTSLLNVLPSDERLSFADVASSAI